MRAYLFAAVPILLWAATPLLVTELTAELPVFQVNWLVTVFSIVSLSLILTAGSGWRKIRGYSKRNLGTMLLLGVTGLFSVQNKRRRFDALPAMWMYNLGALPLFTAVALLASPLVWPTTRSWLLLLGLGGVVNGCSYLFWILALREGDTAGIANVVYLTPFLALVYLAVFRKQPVTAVQLFALLLVVSGPVLQRVGVGKKHGEIG